MYLKKYYLGGSMRFRAAASWDSVDLVLCCITTLGLEVAGSIMSVSVPCAKGFC
jgi:hypothetical protein